MVLYKYKKFILFSLLTLTFTLPRSYCSKLKRSITAELLDSYWAKRDLFIYHKRHLLQCSLDFYNGKSVERQKKSPNLKFVVCL